MNLRRDCPVTEQFVEITPIALANGEPAMDMVLKLGERGFSKELNAGSWVNLQQEIAKLLTNYAYDNRSELIDPDQSHPSWRNFCKEEHK